MLECVCTLIVLSTLLVVVFSSLEQELLLVLAVASAEALLPAAPSCTEEAGVLTVVTVVTPEPAVEFSSRFSSTNDQDENNVDKELFFVSFFSSAAILSLSSWRDNAPVMLTAMTSRTYSS